MSSVSPSTVRDPRPTSERIVQLAARVLQGDIILPEFQRPFVWQRKQILELLDSIYKNYPIGSLLVWESREKLASKRAIADLEIEPRSEIYPVNYLLDGQQRLSAICGVIHWSAEDPNSVWNVYFDLKTSRFRHADSVDGLPVHQIPLRRLSDPADFFQYLNALDDQALKDRASFLFSRFMNYQVPLVTLGEIPLRDVAPVFERINSTGTKLTIYDLMRAATWTPEFDLGNIVETIKSALEPKKFNNLDDKTFLRTLGAAAGGDFSANSITALRDLDRASLKTAATEMRDASLRAVDFLATDISAPRSESLPYANQFAFLCEVFRVIPIPTAAQRREIIGWFWRTTFTSYFGGWNTGQMVQDAKRIREFAAATTNSLGDGGKMPPSSLWKRTSFQSNSATSKMLALMFAAGQPLDLISGQRIDVGKSLAWSNDKEYHHFFPKAYLDRLPNPKPAANLVGNIVLLTSISNIRIKDKAPSQYLGEILLSSGREELLHRLATNLVPEEALDCALADDYAGFLEVRSEFLNTHAVRLMGSSITITEPISEPLPSETAQESEDGVQFGDDVDEDTTD